MTCLADLHELPPEAVAAIARDFAALFSAPAASAVPPAVQTVGAESDEDSLHG